MKKDEVKMTRETARLIGLTVRKAVEVLKGNGEMLFGHDPYEVLLNIATGLEGAYWPDKTEIR